MRVFFLVLLYTGGVSAARILAIYRSGKSHYQFARPYLRKLATRGHDVTVYTLHSESNDETTPNYREVDLSECLLMKRRPHEIEPTFSERSGRAVAKYVFLLSFEDTSTIASFEQCPPLMALLQSTRKYDLLVTETFRSDAMLMFAIKFDVPFVATVPNVLFPFHASRVGNAANPSYVPTLVVATALGYSSSMTFLERVVNTVGYVLTVSLYYAFTMRRENEVIRHFLGPSAPSLYDIVKNTSLILSTNSDSVLSPACPQVPNVVQVAGMHIQESKLLPKNIEKFINESTDGVVYFSMGSVLRGASFPEEKRSAFLKAFSRLRQRVLWKWEDSLPGKSDNIMISKWMPQRDILAHPNVKLFISHGGLLGISEAVYEGVPILGIPIFGDQKSNIKNIEDKGAGEILDYHAISEEVVYEKVSRLLKDPRYKKNAEDLSIKYKDRPMSPLDTAVYWTEYVIRHKGAPHLRTAAVHMPWYQYLLLDVIAFLVLIVVIVFAILYFVLRFVYRLLFRARTKVKTN